jgi:hypothetical protein
LLTAVDAVQDADRADSPFDLGGAVAGAVANEPADVSQGIRLRDKRWQAAAVGDVNLQWPRRDGVIRLQLPLVPEVVEGPASSVGVVRSLGAEMPMTARP